MKLTQSMTLGWAILTCVALAGCGGGDDAAGVVPQASPPVSAVPAGNGAPVTPPVVAPGASPVTPVVAATAPTITGSPATGVMAGASYSFTPTASDVDGDLVTFSITGKPSWALFSLATGALTGSPTSSQIGSYDNIVITASDGSTADALTAFSVNVTSPGTGNGSATLSWTAPIENSDGSVLTSLSGYRIHHGSSADAMTAVATISNAGITTYVFDALSSGTHYFAVSAVNSLGLESVLSAVGSKRVL